MSKAEREEAAGKVLFLNFDGNYGGDKYEDWLCAILSAYVPIEKKSEKRLGGIRTLKSLLKLVLHGNRSKADFLVRPFGLPVFRKNMTVVFHHYDHAGLPWYGRLIEWVDRIGLKVTGKLFNTKFLVVSNYWGEWLRDKGFHVEYLIYNQVPKNDSSCTASDRQYLADKYGLSVQAKWVFLGGDQAKKGGHALLEKLKAAGDFGMDYQFIFSGKNGLGLGDNVKTLWIDNADYDQFLRQLHAVVANSLFEEGWCRVVHEAVVSDVPVAGSGRGGMSELLSIAGYKPKSTEEEMVEFIRNPLKLPVGASANVLDKIESNNSREITRLATALGMKSAPAASRLRA